MNKIYSQFTEFSFKRLTILLCFLGDLFVIRFIYAKMHDKDLFNRIFEGYKSIIEVQLGEKFKHVSFPREFIQEIYQLTLMITGTMFVIIIALHTIIYFFYYKGKKFSFDYIKVICLIGVPGSFMMVIPSLTEPIYSLGFFTVGIFYLFIILGMKKFPYSKTLE